LTYGARRAYHFRHGTESLHVGFRISEARQIFETLFMLDGPIAQAQGSQPPKEATSAARSWWEIQEAPPSLTESRTRA